MYITDEMLDDEGMPAISNEKEELHPVSCQVEKENGRKLWHEQLSSSWQSFRYLK